MRFPQPRHLTEFPGGRTTDNGKDYDRLEDGYRKAIIKERQATMTEREKRARGL